MEGKALAIDSSIWIYQFQATMRDKDGRALFNAHVLGFLRRICKLLFYGIKPVFVFDGGAPALKRMTIVRIPYIARVLVRFLMRDNVDGKEKKEGGCSRVSHQTRRKVARCPNETRSLESCRPIVRSTENLNSFFSNIHLPHFTVHLHRKALLNAEE